MSQFAKVVRKPAVVFPFILVITLIAEFADAQCPRKKDCCSPERERGKVASTKKGSRRCGNGARDKGPTGSVL